jgi:hypothetical protein
MSARNNLAWDLLDQDSDPVPGDPERVSAAQRRYANTARTIHETADRLRTVSAADGLKGKYADKMQDKAKDVVNDLTKASGRYDAVAEAVGVYQPALQHARDESAAAVHDAEDAKASQTKAQAMPDPSANRPSDAPPLSQADQDAIRDRTNAASSADTALAAAKTRLRNAVDALDAAGRALEQAVTANKFKDDHLSDTTLDKFNAVLKAVVKGLQWVGIALAAVALIFPGVAAFGLLAVAIAALVLVIDITLAAQGETSWIDVAFAAVGVVLLGGGSLLAKGLQNMGKPIRDALGSAYGRWANPQVENQFGIEMQAWMNGTSTIRPAQIVANRSAGLAANTRTGRTAGGLLPEFPEWWQFSHPEYLAFFGRQMRDNNIFSLLKNGNFLNMYPKFFAGLDVVSALNSMGKTAVQIPGVAVNIPSGWFYGLAAALRGIGYGMFGFGLASGPVSFVPGDNHHIPAWDDAKGGATSG